MKRPSKADLRNLEVQQTHGVATAEPGVVRLALDFGEKFCGLAYAPDGVTVLPLQVVKTTELESTLRRVVTEKQVEALIIGLPVSGDGTENHICAQIRQRAALWQQRFSSLEITLINERFSSQATLSPSPDRIDDLAAMQILDFYLRQHKS